jgi:membrane-bound metal-dependent hydrolase YbcI (DUF457 family)
MAGDWWGLFLASLSLSQSIDSVSTVYSLDDLSVWVFVVHHREFAVVLLRTCNDLWGRSFNP